MKPPTPIPAVEVVGGGPLTLTMMIEGPARAAAIPLVELRFGPELERLWREEADRVGAVKLLLEANGCDCDCDCDAESHDADCDRCLACRISWAIQT